VLGIRKVKGWGRIKRPLFCTIKEGARRNIYNSIVNVATGGANVVAPGVSVVIAGTASIITGAICFDQQLDQFNDTECPLCRETWVNQCCM